MPTLNMSGKNDWRIRDIHYVNFLTACVISSSQDSINVE
jgi:hypothetical protein